MEIPPNILLVDKPKGITSFDVIRRLRECFKEVKGGYTRTPTSALLKRGGKRSSDSDSATTTGFVTFLEKYIAQNPSTQKLVCGHAGTLDPLASGLLLIGVGEGTKKLSSFLKLPKVYQADILLGIRTSTGDLEGNITMQKEVTDLNEKQVTSVLEDMVGVHELPVPLYSATKKGGKPLYTYAREGKEVEVPKKQMEIKRVKLFDISNRLEKKQCTVSMELEVSSGTYIRSVAEEIGRRLGYPATLQNLRRTQIGEFKVKDARKV